MSSTFPRTSKKILGYKPAQVDEFLAAARRAYDAYDAEDTTQAKGAKGSAPLTAEAIRHTGFPMQKGGYSPEHVDAALERLEDAFAAKERRSTDGTAAERARKEEEVRQAAQEIVTRLGRPPEHRFTRTSMLTVGYNRKDVDRFANRIVKYFADGRPLSVKDVRTAVFRPQRGGYREAQVDMLLDCVVDAILSVR